MCALLEMEVSNASLYDGATALAEAVNASMFTPEQLTAVLASQLQDRFNKPVVVDSARLVVFRGIRVQGLRVIDPKSPGEDMISSGPFTVDYQFWPLLMTMGICLVAGSFFIALHTSVPLLSGMGATNRLSNDFPLFRYADILMMKAECLLRTGHGPGSAR